MTAGKVLEASAKAVSRRLTRWEIGVDGGIHVVAILAGVVGSIILLVHAVQLGKIADVVVVGIYSACLLVMLSCSAAYNLGRFTRHGRLLRNLDQAAIFLMIAGTYTPFTVLHLDGPWSAIFTGVVWGGAALGILLRLLHGRLFDRASLAIYLTLGWMALVILVPLLDALDAGTLLLLGAGGAMYTIGVVFHVWERLPFQTAIWHLFVVAAAALHFAAVAVSLHGGA